MLSLSTYLTAFLCMQESRRGDCCHQEWAAWDVKIAGTYQFPKDFDPNDPTQPLDAITNTPPESRHGLANRGTTQARNTLEDPCVQSAMDYCAPSYDLVLVVEVALGIFHGDLKVGSPEHIHT